MRKRREKGNRTETGIGKKKKAIEEEERKKKTKE